jgi:hypothetical protein
MAIGIVPANSGAGHSNLVIFLIYRGEGGGSDPDHDGKVPGT